MQDLSHFASNNWELFFALFIILFLLARTWFGPGSINMLLPTETIQMINRKNALLVDVRTDKEYNEGHVMNALHIPLGMLDNRAQELQAYKDTAVVLVCRTGARSGQAAVKLKKLGFNDVHNMGGGMLAWERAKLPVTTAVGKPPKPGVAEPENETPTVDSEHQVLVYSSHACPFSTRAIDLLESKGVCFTEIRIDKDSNKRSEMESRSGSTSVPQIFIGNVHVGGCDEMYALDDKGELDGLLGLSDVKALEQTDEKQETSA